MTLGNGSSPETLGRPGSSGTDTPALDDALAGSGAQVTLRSLAPASGGAPAVTVHAGGTASVRFIASATAPTPAEWEAQVTGLPDGWACIAPVTWPADAVPGGCEWELRVDVTPPRTAGSQARRWDFEVLLVDRRTRQVAARLPASLEVLPFAALDLHVEPWMASGRRRARYVAIVANDGNRAVPVCLSAGDDAGRLRARVVPDRFELAAGQRRRAEVVLRPRRPRLIGPALQRRATVRARPDTGGAPPVSREIAFLQERTVGLWALVLCAVLIAGVVVGLSQLPERVAVPAVQGAGDAADAERALRAAGLTLDPHVRSRATAAARPGTILAQIPDPGTRVERGARVTVLVAVGQQRAIAPRLDGLTGARAAALVRGAGLSPGPTLGAGGPDGVVAVQFPRAGQRVPRGTAVTLFLRPRGARPDGWPARASALPGSSVAVKVPAVEDRGTIAYTRALAGDGLVPKVIRAVHPAPPGTLVGVRPRAGTPVAGGETVRVVVSAGVPRLAFDTGAVVRLLNPRTGRTVREAAPPQGRAVEPSWSADGRRVLYRVGRRLLVASGTAAERGRVVHDGPEQYASATFAPTGAADVVALVRRTRGDGDLCLARVGDRSLRARCVRDRRWDLGRQISWRADGRELLVFGVRRGRPDSFGILRYRTARPFSTTPADWRGELATDASVPRRGVIAAAYAPQGDRVALVTNAGVPRFQLAVTAGDLRRPVRTLPVRACEVAWRPDGGEIAVVQSDDACRRPLGDVVRVDLRRPRRTVTAATGARHPAYQPLTYAGPRGLG